MDIGIQRDTRICLKDCDWEISICKVACLLTAPLLALMIMIAPAQAAIESISPASFCFWSSQNVGCAPTIQVAGDSACLSVQAGSAINITTAAPNASLNQLVATVNCSGSTSWNWSFNIVGYGRCPTVTPSYTYNEETRMCERPVQVTCPINPLPALPKGDLCTESLEKGAGEDVNNACTLTLDKRWIGNNGQMKCLADKINKLPLMPHYTKPSATIRTTAYQNHLLNVFNKLEEIEKTQLSDAEKQKCASVIADVNVHKLRHGIVSEPSAADDKAPHVLGKAIDIPEAIANALIAKVTTYNTVTLLPNCSFCIPITVIASDVENYVKSASINPPACNVRWGGRFGRVDNVHFQLP